MYICIVRGVKVAKKGISSFPVGIFGFLQLGGIWEGGGSWSSTHRQPQIWIQKIFLKKFYKNIHIALIVNYLFNRERYRTGIYWG